jgi:tetratricopeptide (TPR) repeat protein
MKNDRAGRPSLPALPVHPPWPFRPSNPLGRRIAPICLAAMAWLGASAHADTIFLKNGQRIEGHIISETPRGYTIEAGTTLFELSYKITERVIKYTRRETSLALLGDSFLEKQDYELARRYYQRAAAISGPNQVIQARLRAVEELLFRRDEMGEADAAFRREEFRLAADLYMALLAGQPNAVVTREVHKKAAAAYCALSKDYFDAVRYDEAISELRRAMELNPRSARAHALAGHLLAGQGKYGTAYEEFALALEIDQTEPLALEGLEMLGRDLDEYFGAHVGQTRWKSDMRPLEELFGEAAFHGRSEAIAYSALGADGLKPYAADVDLRTLIAASREESQAPTYQFRSPLALSIFLQAYNAGPGAVAMYGGAVPYTETRNYVKRVSQALEMIRDGRIGATPYDALIEKHALNFGFHPHLIKAIVKVESNFNPRCVSSADARGLIQLVRVDWDDTLKRLGRNEDFGRVVFDPEWNLFVGCHYLRWLIDTALPKHFKEEFGKG